ncbi:protein of unknown function [Blastococcus saxobsidens DD2]|uniref:Uncharacterized protein n=1 Tax=Blastococcus saxobsidens (strain DD2) TaxID=1146883 RepID=H6RWU9_BLASD|nr:protein of unknown function [Blastococcus saxobsidens DD2]
MHGQQSFEGLRDDKRLMLSSHTPHYRRIWFGAFAKTGIGCHVVASRGDSDSESPLARSWPVGC